MQSRNSPCACGSGRKYKKCCGAVEALAADPPRKERMGLFQEYVAKGLTPGQLEVERRSVLQQIGDLTGASVLSYAARFLAGGPAALPIQLHPEDLLPFEDILDGISSPKEKPQKVVILLETPGGSGETARDMVELLHERFDRVVFVIPGMAKSAGTIMALGGHDILMGPGSSLGPIDAQLQQEGKAFSADALIEGLNRIKKEVEDTGKLSPAYIPFLQKLSPGEIQHAHNALEFARVTVRDWLVKYKFSDWNVHSSTGLPVSDEEKKTRAYEISTALSSQSRWLSHGYSLRIPDLEALRLKIVDFSADTALNEAIRRYQVLLRLAFEAGSVFKIIESPLATYAKQFAALKSPPLVPAQGGNPLPVPPNEVGRTVLEVTCPRCGTENAAQLDFQPGQALEAGAVQYPRSGILACKSCGTNIDLRPVRQQVEAQIGRPALTPP